MAMIFKGMSQLKMIFILRSVAICIQLLLILFVNLFLHYQLPWLPLLVVIGVEVAFTIVSYFYYRKVRKSETSAIFVQIIADVLFLSLLLYFSGGATNAFVSLLLIPIAIAAVTLSHGLLALVALGAIGSYSLLLWQLPMHVMHGNMEGHFIAMWINFLFSTTVVAIVVGKMSRSIRQRERAIATYREELLKQEKVISLGVASAQITHQLATPIATVQLLAEEIQDDLPDNELLKNMQVQLTRCKQSIDSFRQMTFDIKEQKAYSHQCKMIVKQVEDHISLNYPEINSSTTYVNNNEVQVNADASLLPAILNLVNNAVRATKANNSQKIEITSTVDDARWMLSIRDYGRGFTLSKLAELGVKPVSSKQGLGMAVFLSHASLERLGGKLTLTNHHEGGALVTVSIPLAPPEL